MKTIKIVGLVSVLIFGGCTGEGDIEKVNLPANLWPGSQQKVDFSD